MKNQNNAVVSYEKVYTDDISVHMPSLFNEYTDIEHISINKLWGNVIEGFYSVNYDNYICCIHGNIRVVIALDQGNNNWKFQQYYLSGMDGKVLDIKQDTWFAINNMLNDSSIIITGMENVKGEPKINRMSSKIFNWNSKRS